MSTGTLGPVTVVDLALAVLPSRDLPSASLLSGPVHEVSLIPGVNHAFGLNSTDGTQRVSLDIYLQSVAELAGRDHIDPNRRGRSSSANASTADRAATSTLAAFDPRLRLDPSVEAIMRKALQDHRAEVRQYWIDQHAPLRRIATSLAIDPVGGLKPPRDDNQAHGQAREQMRVLSRLARDASKQIDRRVAEIAETDPVQAAEERRRLSLLAANTRAKLDAISRDEPTPDPARARVWDLLNDAQRTYVVSAIRRRYLAQRLERDGLSEDEIRRQLAPTMAMAGLMQPMNNMNNMNSSAGMSGTPSPGDQAMAPQPIATGQMSGLAPGSAQGSSGAPTQAAPSADSMKDGSGQATPSMAGMASRFVVSSDPLMSMMSSMNDSGLRLQLETVTAQAVLDGAFDDVLIRANQRQRLAQLHPGDLERELTRLRQRAVEEVFPLEHSHRYSSPEPPSTHQALAED